MKLLTNVSDLFPLAPAQDASNLFFRAFRRIVRKLWEVSLLDELHDVLACTPPEHDDVHERIGTEPVCTVDGHAGTLASCIKTSDGCIFLVENHTAIVIRWNASHRVMCRRLYRHQLSHGFDPEVHSHKFSDVGQFLVDYLFTEMSEVQMQEVLSVDAATLENLAKHCPGDDIAWGKVKQGRTVPLHELFAVLVEQCCTFAARSFGEKNAQSVHSGRVELEKFHILKRQTAPQRERNTIARHGVGIGRDLEYSSEATRRDHHSFGVKDVQLTGSDFVGDYPFRDVILDEQVHHLKFVEEPDVVLNALLVQRLEDHMSRAIRCVTGSLDCGLTVISCVSSKRPLGDFAFRRSTEGKTPVLKLKDRVDRFPRHDFDRILISEIITSFDCVEHVPFPAVRLHVSQCSTDAALRRAGVSPGGIEFAHNGNARACGCVKRPHQTGTACTNYDRIKSVIRHAYVDISTIDL